MHKIKRELHKLIPSRLDINSNSVNNELMGKLPYILITFILMLLSGVMGYYLKQSAQSANLPIPSIISTYQDSTLNKNLFLSQTATFQGKILNIKGTKLEVVNINNTKGNLELSNKVTIYKYNNDSKIASPSSDIKQIKLNVPTQAMLELKNGKYYVTSITHLPNVQASK